MSENTTHKRERPLSPHLQVYKPQLTSVLSILHRASGVALAIGTLMIVWWLVAAATGADAFNTAMDFSTSLIGQPMLLGWTFALFYHMCNGVRHLIWDTGRMLKLKDAYTAGYIVLLVSICATAYVWLVA